MTSWAFIIVDLLVLWAGVMLGFAWQGYWAEHDWDRDHRDR